jgi:hypothetical protein
MAEANASTTTPIATRCGRCQAALSESERIVTAFTRTYWVIGYAVGIVALLVTRSPLLLIVLILGLWSLAQRWRNPAPGYDSLPPRQRTLIAISYAALITALVATLAQ